MKLSHWKLRILAAFFCLNATPVLRASVMVTNMDQPTGGGSPISFQIFWFASRFATDNSAVSFLLENATLDLGAASNSSGGFFVSIFSDDSSHPGVQLELLSGTGNPVTAGDYTFTSTGLNLSPNTSYWIVAGVSSGAGSYTWNLPTTDTYAGPWTIPATVTHAHSENQGASWETGDGFARQFSVSAVAVPEPAPFALLGLGLGAYVFLLRRRR